MHSNVLPGRRVTRGLSELLALTCTLLLAASTVDVYAQAPDEDASRAAIEWLRLTPALIGPTKAFNPGLRVRVDVDRSIIRVAECDPLRFKFSLGADLPFAWDPDRNPESLETEGQMGVLVPLIKCPEAAPGEPPPLEAPTRWGFFEVLLEAGLEASQEIPDADFQVGATGAYEHDQRRLWFLPGVEVGFFLVDCLGCDLPDEAETWFRRLDIRGGWSIPLDPLLPQPLDPLRIRPEGRYFRSWGLDGGLGDVRNEDGTWWSIELAYAFDDPYWLHEVHAGWRGGEVPVHLAEDRAWTVGLTVIL